MMASRQLAFRVLSLWVLLAGLILLVPTLADQVFDLHLKNWGVASEYGGVLIGLAALYWLFSTDAERYAPVMRVLAFGLLLNAVINAYWWAVGHYTLQSAGFNIVLNSALAAWFWTLRPRSAALMPPLDVG